MKKTSPVIKDPIFNKKGLTLIELAIILSIISITSALSLPSMTSLWSNLRLNKAASDLMVNFHQAKMEAVKRNILCTTTFNVSLSGQDYDYVVYVDDDRPWDWYNVTGHYRNITYGMYYVANNGTVYVFDGTYNEHVIGNKSVKIIGNGSGQQALP